MLARAVVVIAFVGALATALLHTCALLARARVHHVAATAVAASFDAALASAQAGLAANIAAGGDPRGVGFVPPTPAPACASPGSEGACALTISVAFAATTVQGVATSGGGDCVPQCARDLQGNDAVDEGRFALRIEARADGPTGTVFASRDRYAIFRTMRVAPYASLIGTRDVGGESIAVDSSEGDDAGTPALTTIDVRYVNAATGAKMEGNAWQTRSWSSSDASGTAWEP